MSLQHIQGIPNTHTNNILFICSNMNLIIVIIVIVFIYLFFFIFVVDMSQRTLDVNGKKGNKNAKFAFSINGCRLLADVSLVSHIQFRLYIWLLHAIMIYSIKQMYLPKDICFRCNSSRIENAK